MCASSVIVTGKVGPHQLISIKWKVDNASGSTECEAWRGQHEIDCLTRAGYTVLSIEPRF
jgi:hypothetical protein